MATPNTPPPGGSTPQMNPSQVRKQLKDLLDDQGDYNNLLKESIASLNQVEKAYAKISARLNTLSKDSINVKAVNRDLLALAQKDYLEKKALSRLEDEMSTAAYRTAKRMEELGKDGFAYLKKKGNLEDVSLLAAYKRTLLSEQELNKGKELLDQEKMVSRQLGISGNLMKGFAEKLGFGEDAYSAMALAARKVVDENGKVTNPGKWKVAAAGIKSVYNSAIQSALDPAVISALMLKGLGAIGKAAGKTLSVASGAMASLTDVSVVQKMTSGISDMLKNIPLIGGLLGGLVDTMASFLDLAIGASSKVQKMGRELGLSAVESQKLNVSFNNFANSSSDALLNSQKLFETQIELGNQLGVLNTLSNDRLQTDIHLKDVAGLDLETRSSLVESSTILGKNQTDIMNSVFAQVEGLKQATGIQLNQKGVLKEAANLGGFLGLSFAKYPAQLTKSLISIKAMGLELKQLDSMASSFLDFESSISSEFEAQLLTGKNINLSKARELFLNNDLAGAAQEITSQIGTSADFLSMNRIQAESMAKAFGMSRDQLGDMLKKQEYMSKIGAKDTDNAQKQYQLALAKYGTQEKMSEMLGKDTANAIMNADAQAKIAGLMDKIKQGFVDLISNSKITGFIDTAIEFISKPENIQSIVNKLQDFFSSVLKVASSVVGGMLKFLNFFPGINIDKSMIDMVENAGSALEGSSMNFGGPSVSTNAAKGSANTNQMTAAAGIVKPGETNVNLRVEQRRDPRDASKIQWKVYNESTHKDTDWQTGY
jgi:hypothetical protein